MPIAWPLFLPSGGVNADALAASEIVSRDGLWLCVGTVTVDILPGSGATYSEFA